MLLALAVLRHWRRARRFTDGTWLIAAVCLGAPRLVWPGEAGFLPAAPFVALLAGSAWDAARSPRLRRAATAAVVVHVLVAVLLWPQYPSDSPASGHARHGSFFPQILADPYPYVGALDAGADRARARNRTPVRRQTLRSDYEYEHRFAEHEHDERGNTGERLAGCLTSGAAPPFGWRT